MSGAFGLLFLLPLLLSDYAAFVAVVLCIGRVNRQLKIFKRTLFFCALRMPRV